MMISAIPLKENVDLKEYSTFHIGGPARFFREIHSIDDMQQTLSYCYAKNLPFFILGKGSNCLFDDRGFDGVVLLNKIDFFEQNIPGTFHVGAGYSFALLGVQTARQGWSGLEFASGIPCSVGGAVFMNAGANGQETCHTLTSVEYVHQDGTLQVFQINELAYAYRHSPFQSLKGAIVGATFTLIPHQEARRNQIEIVNKRKMTQPLSAKSAGCIFLNPPQHHAGALIERCGLKGLSVGGAQVSDVHANFLINAGNATCHDMLQLIKFVQRRVKEQTGNELKSEVRYIPYNPVN